jgi:hypothetical protein
MTPWYSCPLFYIFLVAVMPLSSIAQDDMTAFPPTSMDSTDGSGGSNNSNSNINSITIQYEYQLEVNYGDVLALTDSARNTNNLSVQQVLQTKIDINLLESLQSKLPHAGITTSTSVPNVRFVNVQSTVYSACFTRSDECGLVRTQLTVDYDGNKPDYSMERVAYQLVQHYLADIAGNSQRQILITYLYPYLVSSLAQFQLDPAVEVMSVVDVAVVEQTFLEVVGATVAAMEGDTEIEDVQFIYQDLLSNVNEEENDDTSANNTDTINRTIQADFKIHGICRECSNTEFAGIVNAIIPTRLDALQSMLRQNGRAQSTTFFDSIASISFGVPRMPDDLPDTEHPNLYDTEATSPTSHFPVFFILGIISTLIILGSGIFFIWKDIRDDYFDDDDYEKEGDVFSTASESAMDKNGDSGSLDDDHDAVIRYPRRQIDRRRAVEEYDVPDPPVADQTTLNEYQVETVLSDENLEEGVQSYPYTEGQMQQLPQGRIPSRPPKGARRVSATVSPATGMPYNSYAY